MHTETGGRLTWDKVLLGLRQLIFPRRTWMLSSKGGWLREAGHGPQPLQIHTLLQAPEAQPQ